MMQLRCGSTGPQVEFLQLALNRAGVGPVATDGSFGRDTVEALRRFQAREGIPADGCVGMRTRQALHPYYTGYLTHRVGRGDTLYNIAMSHHTSLRSMEIANPSPWYPQASTGAARPSAA